MSSPDSGTRLHGAPSLFVSVIVPVLNGEATIGRCLESLLSDTYPEDGREIVVVDNGSTDGTVEVVRGYPVRLVIEPRPGLSRARNRGIEQARGAVIAFTDSDCCVTNGWLRELTDPFEEDEVAAVTGEVVPFPPTTPAERYSARRKPSVASWQEPLPEPWFCFMNTAVRREAFDRVGLFDPSFPNCCEDIDFAWRFVDAGLRVRRLRHPVVFHQQRVTALGLFRQNLRNGRGWALLHRRYPDRAAWGWPEEIAAWADIGRSAFRVGLAYLLARGQSGSRTNPDDRYHELLLKLGQRLGFVRGHLRGLIGSLGAGAASDPLGVRIKR
jgi:GT2 family glycosyltransferase